MGVRTGRVQQGLPSALVTAVFLAFLPLVAFTAAVTARLGSTPAAAIVVVAAPRARSSAVWATSKLSAAAIAAGRAAIAARGLLVMPLITLIIIVTATM